MPATAPPVPAPASQTQNYVSHNPSVNSNMADSLPRSPSLDFWLNPGASTDPCLVFTSLFGLGFGYVCLTL